MHIQGLMVWHSRSRQCILTAIKSLHYSKLDPTILVLYINYFTLFILKVTQSNTARLHDSSDGEYFEIMYLIIYEIDLSKWDDLFIIIDYL